MQQVNVVKGICARIHNGATGSYAFITTPTTSLDVRLADGMPAKVSLQASAQELRDRAAKLIKRAELIEAAGQLV